MRMVRKQEQAEPHQVPPHVPPGEVMGAAGPPERRRFLNARTQLQPTGCVRADLRYSGPMGR
jgi:hypothetical protein